MTSQARSNSSRATPRSLLASALPRATMALCVAASLHPAARFWWREVGEEWPAAALVTAVVVGMLAAAARLRWGRRAYGVLLHCNLLALTTALVLEPGLMRAWSGTVALTGAVLAGIVLLDHSARRAPAGKYGFWAGAVAIGLSLVARIYFGWIQVQWLLVMACAVAIVVLAIGDRRMRYAGVLWLAAWVVMAAVADGVSSASINLHRDMSRIDAVREALTDTALGLAIMSLALVGASAAAMRGRPGLFELNMMGLIIGISVRCYRLVTAI